MKADMNIANTTEVCHEIAPSGSSSDYRKIKSKSPMAREVAK